MVDKEVILTADGLGKLEQELEHLRTVKRREVAERIKQAREFGDISENSEYEDAKKRTGLYRRADHDRGKRFFGAHGSSITVQ